MAYRMPNQYAENEEYSEDDGSVEESIGIDSDFEDDESVAEEYSEYEETEEKVPKPRRSSTRPFPPVKSGSRRQLPARSKSFDGDSRLKSVRGGNGGERSTRPERNTGGNRRIPPRVKSLDTGGPKMRRNSGSKIDREAVASNRARRLRAMGESSGAKVTLLRRSQSFSNRGSKKLSLVGETDNDDDDNDEKSDEEGIDGKSGDKSKRTKKPPRRSTSNDYKALPPEEQQYARTAARGVTRSKSLKAERPNLEKASRHVADRLQALGVSGSKEGGGSNSRGKTSGKDGKAFEGAPKTTGGLKW